MKYRRPPVVEALCEIHFEDSNWDDTTPGRFYDLVQGKGFPKKKQLEIQEAQVELSGTGEASARIRRLQPRVQFISEKGDRTIQLGKDLLVVNQLPPYLQFEDWEPTVLEALALYQKLAGPIGVTKLAMRYINRITLPGPKVSMEKYFTIYPQIPEDMGDDHGSFMVRLELPARRRGHSVLITFGTSSTENEKSLGFLLDLYDVLKPNAPLPLDAVPTEARAAHENIEDAFEGSITTALRERFEPEVAT